MIAPVPPHPPGVDLTLVISISRPTPDIPEGYVCMTAHPKPQKPGESIEQMEDAADGPLNEATIEAVIRDLRSYAANGRKAFANEIERDDDSPEPHR
jgi:hypothetical protein